MLSLQSPILFLLPFIFFSYHQVHGGSLDCNFNWTFCCWHNKGNGVPWQIFRGKSYDHKDGTSLNSRNQDYKLTYSFLATSVTPEQRFSTDWTSCAICSETGLFTVLVRAYQTPKTRIKLCWKFADGDNGIYRHCSFLRNWRSSSYVRRHFTTAPKQFIQFYIKLHNHGQSVATAVIDNIKVVTEECHSPLIQPKHRQMKVYSVQRTKGTTLTTEATTSRQTLSKSPSIFAPNSDSPSILSDIFGDAFAQFLEDDSDGLITEERKFGKDLMHKDAGMHSALFNMLFDVKLVDVWSSRNNAKQNHDVFITTTLIPELPFAFNLLKCNTVGGCLFDQSMCSYQNSPLSRGSIFQRVQLSDKNFMQALTTPNTIAVLETDTSFTEDHKIVFDFLEFTEGQRLYGCCYNTKPETDATMINIRTLLGGKRPSELFCPFATAAHSTPFIWRTERFTCPRGTEKILFMCENSGKTNGACAMDNVRIHKILDVLEIEPCQKNIIAFS